MTPLKHDMEIAEGNQDDHVYMTIGDSPRLERLIWSCRIHNVDLSSMEKKLTEKMRKLEDPFKCTLSVEGHSKNIEHIAQWVYIEKGLHIALVRGNSKSICGDVICQPTQDTFQDKGIGTYVSDISPTIRL